MSPSTCPDLEALFLGLEEGRPEALRHVGSCPSCAAIVDEHRRLEEDLFRVADPPPPKDFVQRVMAKVESAPVPVRRELWTGAVILGAAAATAVLLLVNSGAAGVFGTQLAQALLWMHSFVVSAPNALRAVWQTASLQITLAASVLMAFVLFGLRKFAGGPVEARISA